MLRAYKYRLYPNKEQEIILEATLDTCRHLYNNALASIGDAVYAIKKGGHMQAFV